MALEQAIDDAVKALRQSGGMVTVILGTGVDAPTDWTWHPRVHWVTASELKRHDVSSAIPSNTKLMLITDNISGTVFQPIHDERKRRRLPYMIRKTGNAVAECLKELFPEKVIAAPEEKFAGMPPISGAGNGNGNGAAPAEGEKKTVAPKGSLKAFVEQNANLSTATSGAEEARRLFRLAQQQGITTTLMSIQQSIVLLRRKGRLGSRPESLTPAHVTDTFAVAAALEQAIATLTQVKARVDALDAEHASLAKENEDMKARIALMKDAFAGL